ncbi:MAG TPA: rhomboid family intramembrane serine protease [Methanomassiliicoccales archaeon]|nr:rhomboid family intramembrane serine protease [Methanomassiliicoccales archaeon]
MDAFSIVAIVVMVATLALGMLKRFSLTLMLLIGNLVVFFLEILGPMATIELELGFRPIYLQTGQDLYTIFTSMFVHASIYHIFANMLFLFLFGWPLEERIGKYKVLAIYLVAGVLGLILQSLVMWGSYAVIIGASGAISGLVGGLFILYPRDKLTLPLLIIVLPNVPVWAATLAFFASQLPFVLGMGTSGIAYAAHLGGFLAGMALGLLLGKTEKTRKAVKYKDEGLEPLATTPELKSALERIQGEKQADVRKAWLEYFATKAKCPKCGSNFIYKGDRLVSDCGYEVKLK